MKRWFNVVLLITLLANFTSCSKNDKDCKRDIEELQKTCVNVDWNKIGVDENNALILPVYMDYQATTKIDPRVLQEMNFVENNVYGRCYKCKS